MTGIEYPTISVGPHKDLIVRFSLAAQVLMRRRGMDPAKLGQLLAATIAVPNPDARYQSDPPIVSVPNPDAVGNVITAFGCMVAENFTFMELPQKVDLSVAPSSDYWAIQIDDLPEVERVIYAALGKAAEAKRNRLAVAPPREAAS